LDFDGNFDPSSYHEDQSHDRRESRSASRLSPARVAPAKPSAKYADFHALRHTFITRAWTTGTTPDVVRALARHCHINLTLRYTHTTQAAQTEAMSKMPALPAPLH